MYSQNCPLGGNVPRSPPIIKGTCIIVDIHVVVGKYQLGHEGSHVVGQLIGLLVHDVPHQSCPRQDHITPNQLRNPPMIFTCIVFIMGLEFSFSFDLARHPNQTECWQGPP